MWTQELYVSLQIKLLLHPQAAIPGTKTSSKVLYGAGASWVILSVRSNCLSDQTAGPWTWSFTIEKSCLTFHRLLFLHLVLFIIVTTDDFFSFFFSFQQHKPHVTNTECLTPPPSTSTSTGGRTRYKNFL